MKLSQHLKFSKFLIESKSPGSIYRVMDIEELVHLLRDKEWELTDNKFYNGKRYALGTNIHKIWMECREYLFYNTIGFIIMISLRNF